MQQTAALAHRPSTVRSRITNGSQMLRQVDGRSADARRFKDLVEAFENDLGGNAKLSEGERAMVRQCAANVVASERMQSAVVRGDDISLEQLTRLSNVTARLLQRLGLKRKAKEPPADLRAYAASKRAERAPA